MQMLPLNSVSTIGYTPEPAFFNLSQIASLPITATQLATATRTDKVLSKVYSRVTKGWPHQVEKELTPFFSKKEELAVEGGCVLWGMRVVILELV